MFKVVALARAIKLKRAISYRTEFLRQHCQTYEVFTKVHVQRQARAGIVSRLDESERSVWSRRSQDNRGTAVAVALQLVDRNGEIFADDALQLASMLVAR